MGLLPGYNLKEIAELLKKGATVEAQEKIMELRESLLQVGEENQALKADNARLRAELETRNAMIWRPPFYWGQADEGPFCQRCFDIEKRLVRVHDRKNGIWYCYGCDKTFLDSTHRPQQRRIVSEGSSWMSR